MSGVSSSWRARGAMVALVAGYALIAVVAAAPDSPLTPPLPPRVAAPAGLAHAARWLGLDRLGRFGLTVLSICVLAGLVSSFLVVVVEVWRGRATGRSIALAGAFALAFAIVAPVLLS